ncbi:MAG: hypothetical protein ABW034_25030 [Steroidobacteraceae bacterium]
MSTRRKMQLVRSARWSRMSDEELLQLRLCDLQLSLRGSLVARYLGQLQNELKRRGIRFKPHVWLADEWFSPDGVPGIAIPFYMAHPRLMRLERKMMGEVEGGNASWAMRIIRHEAGHAFDNAFRVRRRKDWRRTFGKASRRYPDVYRVRPSSRHFVLHLGHWYGQSHPTEDFAETFAVWLQPRARWRREYADWPALKKLEYVDALTQAIKGEPQLVTEQHIVAPLEDNRRTLAEHYRRKQARYAIAGAEAYDRRLKRVFGTRDGKRRMRASTFLRQVRPQLTRLLTRRSRLHPYLVHQVFRALLQRSRELDLVVTRSQRVSKRAALGLLERILIDVLRRDRERYTL